MLYMDVLRRAVGLTSVCVRETREMTVFVITPIYTIHYLFETKDSIAIVDFAFSYHRY